MRASPGPDSDEPDRHGRPDVRPDFGAQRRLDGLLRANRLISGDLALPVVLRQIVESAAQVVHARFGALGVLGPGGDLEQFIQVGRDDDTAYRIGHLPDGAAALLAAFIGAPQVVRLADFGADPRAAVLPARHPARGSVLGVPIRVREEVFGSLYLAGHLDADIGLEDEELVLSLAATAGVAIQNARLLDEANRRQDWLRAATAITRQLLATEGEEPLQLIARRVQEIAGADVVNLVLPTAAGEMLHIAVATGLGAEVLAGATYPKQGTVSQAVLVSGEPILLGDTTQDAEHTVYLRQVVPVGPLMVLPLVGTQGVRGAFVVGRAPDRPRFTPADLEMATTFANHAAIALELADARSAHEQVALLEDRDRIARDLHDHVVQRLFGAGLTVESIASGMGDTEPASRLARVVDDIDETIRQIRTSIFRLRGSLGPQTGAVRSTLLEVVAEVAPLLDFESRVDFTGPVDTAVPDVALDDLVAVVRETLTNVARHAHATRVDLLVSAGHGQLIIEISDDGVGMGDTDRRSGLANLRERAERQGGTLVLTSPRAAGKGSGSGHSGSGHRGGTEVRWTIPLP